MSIVWKIAGLILITLGLLTLRNFPGIGQHQRESMTITGISIGLILTLVGIAVLIFG